MKLIRHRLNMGQNLVEFALILPIFMGLVLGIFDLGWVVYSYSSLQNAAREGARYAIVNPYDEQGITTRIGGLAIGLDQNEFQIQTNWTCEQITVFVDYNFHPLIGRLFPEGVIPLHSESTMRREKWLKDEC